MGRKESNQTKQMNTGKDVNGRYPEIFRVLGVDGALYSCHENKIFTALRCAGGMMTLLEGIPPGQRMQ